MAENNRRSADTELALLRKDMDELKLAFAELKSQVSDLLEAWTTATGLVRFIKWTAGLSVAIGLIYAFVKDHIK